MTTDPSTDLADALAQLTDARQVWLACGDLALRSLHGRFTRLHRYTDLAEASSQTSHTSLSQRLGRDEMSINLACTEAWDDATVAILIDLNRIKATIGAASRPAPTWRTFAEGMAELARTDPTVLHTPPPDATVDQIHTWWMTLSTAGQEDLIARHGAQLARIAGIPPRVRDRCNQTRLAFDLRELTNSLDDLRNAGRTLTSHENSERARLKGIVEGLTAIRDRLVRAAEAGETVLLIDYDTAATGTAIIAFNDPDDAEQVNLHVPGGGTTLAKAESTMGNAENLLREVNRLDGPDGPKTSEIVYIYRTPKLPFGVLRLAHADAAAFDLSRFVHSLHVTHDDDVSLYPTITTHSYGTLLVFRAAVLFGVNVIAAATNGAPGSGLETAAQVEIPKVYSGSKENDLLAWASTPRIVHNRSPTADEFGAVVFTTDPGKRGLLPGGLSVGAHFDYLATDGLALYNNAQIIRGREPIPAYSADSLD